MHHIVIRTTAQMSSTCGRGFAPWDELAADPGAVLDAPVRPLVEALNATGCARTVFSCGGHPEEPDSIARGRRQAHVDVAVCDPGRWWDFVRTCKDHMPARIYLRDQTSRHVSPTCVEGSLGSIPDWLLSELPASPPVPKTWARSRWQELYRWMRGEPDPAKPGWHYRRVMFRVMFDPPPEAVRAGLDAALAAAVTALEESRR